MELRRSTLSLYDAIYINYAYLNKCEFEWNFSNKHPAQ